jgi:hypothetical protein
MWNSARKPAKSPIEREHEMLRCSCHASKRADIFWIERLPANRDLRFLRIVLAVGRRLKGKAPEGRTAECSGCTTPRARQSQPRSCRSRGSSTSDWWRDPHFLVDRPNIPVDSGASTICRANALKCCIERVTIERPPRRVILTADSEGDRPAGRLNRSPLTVA